MYLIFDHEAKVIAHNFLDNGISYLAYFRSDTNELSGLFEDELEKFLDLVDKCDELIGYNILGYDIPVFEKYFSLNLKNKTIIDIFKLIVDQHKVYLKLDNITNTTFNESKIAHGLDAVRFYKEGKLDKLKEYCDMDVKLTNDLYLFIKENGYFYYTDGLGNKNKLEIELPQIKSNEDGFGLFV
jgi:DEAD/DEAH box helicase domain-containing protein